MKNLLKVSIKCDFTIEKCSFCLNMLVFQLFVWFG